MTGKAAPRGLFLRMLEWMLAPLVLVWPAIVAATYFAASSIADTTFDRELVRMARALAEEVRAVPASQVPDLPVLAALRHDSVGDFLAQVVRADGQLVAGDNELPAPHGEVAGLRDVDLGGKKVRVAALSVLRSDAPAAWVQVGEPYARRRDLVGQVTLIVMVTVALLLPITIALVWLGLRRGLLPLEDLGRKVESRRSDDLSALDRTDVPHEIAPVVDALNRQLANNRRNSESQRRFVADAAHQLRTPLAGLKTQAQAAQRSASVQEVKERLQRIEEGAGRMSHLVAQLLVLERADDARSESPAMETVDLNGVLREVCEHAAPAAIARGVSLAYEPADGAPRVRAAPVLLRELFANLVDNAVRYTPDGGEVAVRVQGGAAPSVAVEDTGEGIPEAEREMVFERFHRVLGTGKPGSGLGLAIVRSIAEFHRASVTLAEGAGGRGCRFVVSFPPAAA